MLANKADKQACSIWSPLQVYCTVCTLISRFPIELCPNTTPYQTRFDKVRAVGKSRFHYFHEGGSLIITAPPQNRSANSNATIPGMNGPPIYMGRPYTWSADGRMPEARGKLAALGRHVNATTEVISFIKSRY